MEFMTSWCLVCECAIPSDCLYCSTQCQFNDFCTNCSSTTTINSSKLQDGLTTSSSYDLNYLDESLVLRLNSQKVPTGDLDDLDNLKLNIHLQNNNTNNTFYPNHHPNTNVNGLLPQQQHQNLFMSSSSSSSNGSTSSTASFGSSSWHPTSSSLLFGTTLAGSLAGPLGGSLPVTAVDNLCPVLLGRKKSRERRMSLGLKRGKRKEAEERESLTISV